jgi:hypothetical protein
MKRKTSPPKRATIRGPVKPFPLKNGVTSNRPLRCGHQ